MGQKVHPKIFRLGLNKSHDWDLKYIETKTNESSKKFFESHQIRNYVKTFLYKYNLLLHNCKIALSNNALHIFASYYVAQKFMRLTHKKNFSRGRLFKYLVLSKKNRQKKAAFIPPRKLKKNFLVPTAIVKKETHNTSVSKKSLKKKAVKIDLKTLKKRQISLVLSTKITKSLVSVRKSRIDKIKKFLIGGNVYKENLAVTLEKLYNQSTVFGLNVSNNFKFGLKLLDITIKFKKYIILEIKKNFLQNSTSSTVTTLKRYCGKKMYSKNNNLIKSNLIKILFFLQTICYSKPKTVKFFNKLNRFCSYLIIRGFTENRKIQIKRQEYRLSIKDERKSHDNASSKKDKEKRIKFSQFRAGVTRFKKRYFYYKKICRNKKKILLNNFINLLLESLMKFTKNRYSIFLTLEHTSIKSVNPANNLGVVFSENKFLVKNMKDSKDSPMFKMLYEVVFISIKKTNSAEFLANFISTQLTLLRKQKKHRLFLNGISRILRFYSKIIKSIILGIKIIVKGRINKIPRANKKTFKILLGRVPLQTIRSKIDYATTTSYTPGGTLGTQVWINYKKVAISKK